MNLDNKIAIKNTVLINISGNSTLNQRRLFNAILHKIFDKLGDFSIDYFYFDTKDFAELLGNKTAFNHVNFKRDLRALMKTVVSWDVIDKNNEIKNWEASVLVSSAVIDSGKIQIEIPKMLRQKIVENKQYIKLNLALQNKFSSKYSLIVYELCKEFFIIKNGSGETPWLSLENFKYLVGVEEGKYSDLRNIKKRIINIATKEINELSDIKITAEFKKELNKISRIKFRIIKNLNYEIEGQIESTQPFLEFESKISSTKKPYTNIIERNNSFYRSKTTLNPLKTSILSLGINEKQIDEWLEQHSTEYLQAKYDLTISQMKAGKIKNTPSGFMVRAVQDDYGSKVGMDEIIQKESLEARKLSPETCLVDPFEFSSYEKFEERIKELKTQYYNPFFIQSEVEAAGRGKWSK